MTAARWVKSNDGSVRIFDGLLEESLILFAAPDIVTDKRYSSGLVLDYQQYGGQLIAGGNTKYIRTLDVASEKCIMDKSVSTPLNPREPTLKASDAG